MESLSTPEDVKRLMAEYQKDEFLKYCSNKIEMVIKTYTREQLESELRFWTEAMADHEEKYYSALRTESERQKKLMGC